MQKLTIGLLTLTVLFGLELSGREPIKSLPPVKQLAEVKVVERVVSTRNDRSDTSAHRAFANFQFSIATDQGRVAYLYAGHIRD